MCSSLIYYQLKGPSSLGMSSCEASGGAFNLIGGVDVLDGWVGMM